MVKNRLGALGEQSLKMKFVDTNRVAFTDGETTVELYDIGPGPHAAEMLVAYLPKQKIIYEADLFDELAGLRRGPTIQLSDWIDARKLEVESIVPVHGAVTSIAEFRKDVANFKRSGRPG